MDDAPQTTEEAYQAVKFFYMRRFLLSKESFADIGSGYLMCLVCTELITDADVGLNHLHQHQPKLFREETSVNRLRSERTRSQRKAMAKTA